MALAVLLLLLLLASRPSVGGEPSRLSQCLFGCAAVPWESWRG